MAAFKFTIPDKEALAPIFLIHSTDLVKTDWRFSVPRLKDILRVKIELEGLLVEMAEHRAEQWMRHAKADIERHKDTMTGRQLEDLPSVRRAALWRGRWQFWGAHWGRKQNILDAIEGRTP